MNEAIYVLGVLVLGLIGLIVMREEQHAKQVKELISCLIANNASELKMLRAQPRGAVKKNENERRNAQPVDPVLGTDY